MISSGPRSAKIIALGQTPGPNELRTRVPFSGGSGFEWDDMLNKAGLSRAQIFCFNVIDKLPPNNSVDNFFAKKREASQNNLPEFLGRWVRDPDIITSVERVEKTISAIEPNVIIALGDLALWALTGESSITKWRGSIMESREINGRTFKVIPTFNPAFILRNYPSKWVGIQDHRRARNESFSPDIDYPERSYLIRPTFDDAIEAIERARGKLVTVDLETLGDQIACIGIGYSKTEAACIPLITTEGDKLEGYWTPEEELAITLKFIDVFSDPTTKTIFHNGLFDVQIFAGQWGWAPECAFDTMILQHVCYPELRKSLDFCASLYCKYYRYWKDDGKKWDPLIHSVEQHWRYNCDDCVNTYEVHEVQQSIIEKRNLGNAASIQMRLFRPVLKMMLRGVNIDQKFKSSMTGHLQLMLRERAEWFERVLGHPLNPLSNAATGQMRKLFYEDLNVEPYIDRKTKKPSLNDEGLEDIKRRKPVLRPLIEACQEYRSINTFKSNYGEMVLSPDGRVRHSMNLSKVKTFRFSTEENIRGEGRNLQNISSGREEKE